MVKINFQELKLDHIVVFKKEDAIFAFGRENGNGKIRIFLAFGKYDGNVYTRNGRAESWELLDTYDAETIRQRINRADEEGIAIYQFNGSCKLVTGKNTPVQ